MSNKSYITSYYFWYTNCKNCKFDKNNLGEQKDEFQCDKLCKIMEVGKSFEFICNKKEFYKSFIQENM